MWATIISLNRTIRLGFLVDQISRLDLAVIYYLNGENRDLRKGHGMWN